MCVTVGERRRGRLVAAPLQKAGVEDAKMFVTVETPGGDSVMSLTPVRVASVWGEAAV